MENFSRKYLDESIELIRKLDDDSIEKLAAGLSAARAGGGRLFILDRKSVV